MIDALLYFSLAATIVNRFLFGMELGRIKGLRDGIGIARERPR